MYTHQVGVSVTTGDLKSKTVCHARHHRARDAIATDRENFSSSTIACLMERATELACAGMIIEQRAMYSTIVCRTFIERAVYITILLVYYLLWLLYYIHQDWVINAS